MTKKITNKEILRCLEKSKDGLLISGADGEILYANEVYPVLTKINSAALPGTNIKDFIRSGIIETEPACLIAVRRKKQVVKLHAQNSNRVFIVCVSQPFFDESGNIDKVLTTVQDVTEFFSIRDGIEDVQVAMEKFTDNIPYIDEYGDNIVAASEPMRKLLDTARMVAVFDVPVLILGESGVGKEVVARFIHDNSHRNDGPFIGVNCAAIPGHLLETELFGYAKGTFTGQLKDGKDGLFGAARGGTLFLDEIGDMPLELQVKILRVLEMKAYMPVGNH